MEVLAGIRPEHSIKDENEFDADSLDFGGVLSFRQWHQMGKYLKKDRELLIRVFETRTRSCCRPREKSTDVATPTMIGINGEWRVSEIFAQVKNWSESLGEADLRNIEESTDAWAAEILGDVSYMRVVMSVGSGGVNLESLAYHQQLCKSVIYDFAFESDGDASIRRLG